MLQTGKWSSDGERMLQQSRVALSTVLAKAKRVPDLEDRLARAQRETVDAVKRLEHANDLLRAARHSTSQAEKARSEAESTVSSLRTSHERELSAGSKKIAAAVRAQRAAEEQAALARQALSKCQSELKSQQSTVKGLNARVSEQDQVHDVVLLCLLRLTHCIRQLIG